MSQNTPTFAIVTYKTCHDNAPRQSFREWGELSQRLTRHTPRPDKNGPAWSPVEYIPEQPRGNANVLNVVLLVADVDDGTPANELREKWKTPRGQWLQFALHSSYSSTLEHPKYRVVFPLAYPVPAADWPGVHRKLTLALFGDHADPACKDAARLYFLPACPPDALETAFADAQDGELLDPADFPDPEPEAVADTQMRRAFLNGPPRLVSGGGTGAEKPGDDFSERGNVLEILVRHGWQIVSERGGASYLRRPGKTHDISGTFGYGGGAELLLLHVLRTAIRSQRFVQRLRRLCTAGTRRRLHSSREGAGRAGLREQKPVASSPSKAVPTRSAAEKTITEIEPIPSPAAASWPDAASAMYHGLAGDIVRVLEPHTEADPVAILVQFLVGFGSVIGRHAHFVAEADKHFTNLNAVMIGVSSKGRKGTSWGQVRRLFERTDETWTTSCLQSGLSSGEGLIHAVRDPFEKEVKNKKTGEMETVLEDAGVTDKRLLVMESEFASVLRVAGRDGNTLSAILRDAWDKGSLQTMTKNSAARATGAHISLVGHITADELRRELTSTEAGNGFANRFLWVMVRRSKELPEGGSLQEHELSPLILRLQKAITGQRAKTRCVVMLGRGRSGWKSIRHCRQEDPAC